MILLLDQGNSRLKWLLMSEGGQVLARGRGGFKDDVRLVLNEVCSVVERMGGGVVSVHGCSVLAGDQLTALSDVVLRKTGLQLELVSPGAEFDGVRNGYQVPSTLGADRWLAVVGAWRTIKKSLLVVDAGTAMTIDAVDGGGRHLGGYIVPGYGLQCAALGRHAAAISEQIPQAEREIGWGINTSQAVAHGVLLGLTTLIERALVELESAVADTATLVMTGGDAGLLVPVLARSAVVDEDLVFRGLWAMVAPVRTDLSR